MRTIGQAFHLNGSEKCNNFLLIRLLAATLVLYGHSFVFSAKGATEFFSTKLGYHYAGDVGVNIFFVVSGFLVTASMCHRNNLIDFAISRALRIYPALLIFLFLTAILVGPFFSTVSLKEYFESNLIWTYFYNNITFTRYSGIFQLTLRVAIILMLWRGFYGQ